ncbi:tRNA 2-thiouridine(34) synthase MnmA [Candidatus Saccharibacteria bacterium]|nr:tRNA 2-thiouridine(34) synthase MnmA [Candidatus Saccharibacteria bacterium]
MSGGVDSSLSALLLKQQGYRVAGVYMKNWSKNLPGMKCPWAEDLADAKRVAVQLGLDFRVFDFEHEYKQRVVDYMLAEFRAGRTPNPDIMCNAEIKFKLFYETAKRQGADFIATGHYARSAHGELQLAQDQNKDQTYFLYRIPNAALSDTLFPLADLEKPEVKRLAAAASLPNARKKESMGVCFVGDVGIKDFLKTYLPVQPGEIRELETDRVLGYHDGAVFYTLGQRHGLYVGGGLPYYVVKKDLEQNLVYVSKNLNSRDLWTKELPLENLFLRDVTALSHSPALFVRLRHRAPFLPARLVFCSADEIPETPRCASADSLSNSSDFPPTAKLLFSEEIKRPASGQSAVFYSGTEPGAVCLGGGIVS